MENSKLTIKEGYKQTGIGIIPEDWRADKIVNLATITTGAKNTQDKIDEGTYPFFVRSQTIEKINSYSFDGEAVLTAGDGVGTGKIYHYINGKFDFHQRVYKISNFTKELNGYYFFVYFSNHFYDRIMQMTAKSSVDSVRREMIADMKIPIPPLPEQQAIAEVLSDVDALITSLDALLTKKRNIKQGTMQLLLTGKKRLPGFSGNWGTKKLDELGEFKKGKGIKKDSVISDGLPCIRYGEIYTHHNEYIKKFNSFINIKTAKESQKIKSGDLLFASSGETAEEIGKCVAYLGNEEVYAGGDIIILSPSRSDSRFLGFLMNHEVIVKQKSQIAQGDAVVHIYSSGLKMVDVSIPPTIEEQKAIAQVLNEMDAEIEALEIQRGKYQAVKQGMMQELLTGKTRLI
jgi:type I restriction enzyme S subunit